MSYPAAADLNAALSTFWTSSPPKHIIHSRLAEHRTSSTVLVTNSLALYFSPTKLQGIWWQKLCHIHLCHPNVNLTATWCSYRARYVWAEQTPTVNSHASVVCSDVYGRRHREGRSTENHQEVLSDCSGSRASLRQCKGILIAGLHLGLLTRRAGSWTGCLQCYYENTPINTDPDYPSSLKTVTLYAALWIIPYHPPYVSQNQKVRNLTLRIVLSPRRLLLVKIWSPDLFFSPF